MRLFFPLFIFRCIQIFTRAGSMDTTKIKSKSRPRARSKDVSLWTAITSTWKRPKSKNEKKTQKLNQCVTKEGSCGSSTSECPNSKQCSNIRPGKRSKCWNTEWFIFEEERPLSPVLGGFFIKRNKTNEKRGIQPCTSIRQNDRGNFFFVLHWNSKSTHS